MNRLIRNRLWLLIAGIALLGATAMGIANSRRAVPVEVQAAPGLLPAEVASDGVGVADTPGTAEAPDTAAVEHGEGVPGERTATILVHVAGAVNAPGMYELAADARIAHAVEAAGGVAKAAELNSVNLALPLRDGQQVFIPEAQATAGGAGSQAKPVKQAATTVAVPGRIDASAALPEATGHGSATAAPVGSATDAKGRPSKVNVNTAGVDELCELPGIGKVLASRIIDYRTQNGPFAQVGDLVLVSGIGEATLAKLLPFVVVR